MYIINFDYKENCEILLRLLVGSFPAVFPSLVIPSLNPPLSNPRGRENYLEFLFSNDFFFLKKFYEVQKLTFVTPGYAHVLAEIRLYPATIR